MNEARADFETRSDVDLKTCGAAPYFASPHFRPLGLSYRIENGPLRDWEYGQPCPEDLRQHIASGGYIRAWNASFERQCFEWLHRNLGWPLPAIDRYRDTAAEAAALSLPRSLDKAGEALDLAVQKDKEGVRLIRKFSMPRRPRKDEDPNGVLWNEPEDHPEDYALFVKYRQRDVLTEEAAARRIMPLSDAEQAVYTLNEVINFRGIRIDRRSAEAALNLAAKAKKVLDREMRLVTGGYVTACSQPGKLVEWVEQQGVSLSSAAKAEITDLLETDDLPDNVRRALELRQEAAKTSVSKLSAMLKRASVDGRVRGTSMYHGAGTGRFQSVGVNTSNLPRPRKLFDDALQEKALRTDVLFRAFRAEEPELLTWMYGPELGRPLHLISDALRGFIWAAPGHELIQADYSNIEGNTIAWSANEEWKLAAIRELNADPSLPDMYRRTAAAILGLDTDTVTKKHWARQAVGKVAELACFGPDTRVLTDRGPVRIVEVLTTDKLWDGLQWVTHQGVAAKGVRPVVSVDGIAVTPDHLIKLGSSWRPAKELVSSPNTLRQALATGSASLRSLAMRSAQPGAFATSQCNAPADEIRTMSSPATCETASLRAAISAGAQRRGRLGKSIGVTLTSSLTWSTARGYSTASRLASAAATTLAIGASRITGGAAFASSGCATNGLFSLTSSHLTVGITPLLNWIGLMLTGVTSRATSASLRAARMPSTRENLERCKTASPSLNEKSPICAAVYDIVNAGPRNRFTIFSDSGALVVHNCSYGGGVGAFYAMSKGYGVKLDPLFPNIWAQTEEDRRERAVKRYEGQLKRGKGHTDLLSKDAWIACEIIKLGWRQQNAAIAQSWKDLEAAVRDAVSTPGTITTAAKVDYIVRHGFLLARLPSGRCLAYAAPRLKAQVWAKVKLDGGEWSDAEVMDREAAERGERTGRVRIEGPTSDKVTFLGVNSTTKKWERSALYGGLIAENNTQAIARDILVNGMFAAERAGYPIIATVYDEIIAEVPRGFGSLSGFEQLICQLPSWAIGLPLTAGGWRGKRYRKD